MRQRNSSAYDLGAEDEERSSTRLLCHLDDDSGRRGVSPGPLLPCCFVTSSYQGTC